MTIVIVNYNGWPDVARLAAALARSREVASGACAIVVVDNASDGPIPPSLIDPPPGVRLIARPCNGGFAAGVNAGWRESRSPWLLLLNPDVEVGPEFLASVLARIDHHEGRPDGPPGLVGFALRNPDGSSQPSVGAEVGLARAMFGPFLPRSRRSYRSTPRTGPAAWVTGACLLVDSEVMRAIDGMDEDFFLYYEEVALCRSARRLGRRVEYDDRVSVVHLRPLQNRAIAPRMRVIVRHAKLLFFRKHQPGWQFQALAAIVACEAFARGLAARLAGDRAAIGAWKAIGAMSRAMRRGEVVKGRGVLALADAATAEPGPSVAPAISRPHKPIRRVDAADAQSRRR